MTTATGTGIAEATAVQQDTAEIDPNAQYAVEAKIKEATSSGQPVLTDEQKKKIAAEAEQAKQAKQATEQPAFDAAPFLQKMAKEAGEMGRYFVTMESLMAKLVQEPSVTAVLEQKGVDVTKLVRKLETYHALENNYIGQAAHVEKDRQIPSNDVNIPGHFKDAVFELTMQEIDRNNPAPTKLSAPKLLEEVLAKVKSIESPRFGPKNILEEAGLSLQVLNPERAEKIEAENKESQQPLRKYANQIMR